VVDERDQAVNTAWRTAHIYLHNSTATLSEFIADTVVPSVRGIAPTDWHFVRYWWGGPHLRVRMRGVGAAAHAEWVCGMRAALPPAELHLDEASFSTEFTSTSPVGWQEHGEIVIDVPYEAELARYGGAAAMASSERAFTQASQIAGALLGARPRSPELRLIASDTMTLAMHALGLDGHGGARSAHRYFGSWDFVGEQQTSGPEARRAAEATFEVDPDRWLQRKDAVIRSAGDGSDTWRASLFQLFSSLVTDLEALRARGDELENSVAGVLWSQVHMFCNRLGVPVSDERVAAWLTASQWRGPVDRRYFNDDSAAPDRHYLRASGYRRARMGSDQMPRFDVRVTAPDLGRHQVTPLPESQGGPTLGAALTRRRSTYGSYGTTLAASVLGGLLRSAIGEVPTGPAVPVRPQTARRAYPSPSAAYAVDAFVIVRDVEGVEAGCYRYDAARHALERWTDVPTDDELARWSPSFSDIAGTPLAVEHETVPVIVALAPRLDDLRVKYGQRALRLTLLEAGHMSQNLILVSTALDMPSVPLSAYDDDAVNECLHLDGVGSFTAAIIPIGAPRKTTAIGGDAAHE